MKLRNKKTGVITEACLIIDEPGIRRYADSIKDLCEKYEDYTPAEPLIKDEKIRKAVRAWWESIPMEAADKLVLYKKNEDLAVGVYKIYCGAIYPDDTLKAGKTYTIAELCGEEEE